MPRVPQYDRQTSTAPLPNERFTPERPPVQPALDLTGVAGSAIDILRRERERADEVAFQEADAQLAEAETYLLLDPNEGALHQRGKNAFGVPEKVKDAWRKKVGEIGSSLTTNRQKRAFARSARTRGIDLERRVFDHVGGEMLKHELSVAVA